MSAKAYPGSDMIQSTFQKYSPALENALVGSKGRVGYKWDKGFKAIAITDNVATLLDSPRELMEKI